MKYIYFSFIITVIIFNPNFLIGQTLPTDVNEEVQQHIQVSNFFIEDGRISDAGMLLSKVAIIFWNHGITDSSIIYFKKAEKLFVQLEALDKLKSIYSNLGVMYLESGDLKKSIEYYSKCLDATKKVGNHEALAITLIDLSNAYSMDNQSDMAENYAKQAMEIALEEQNHTLVLTAMNQISDVYNAAGKKWKSKEYYLRFNHYQDSVEGDVYSLKSLLAVEYKKFELTEKKSIIIDDKETKKVVPKVKEAEKIITTESVDDFVAERKKQAFESLSKRVDKEKQIQKKEIQKKELAPKSIQFYAVIGFLVLVLTTIFIVIYFIRKK